MRAERMEGGTLAEAFLEVCSRYAMKPAVKEGDEWLSYEEVCRRAIGAAHALKEADDGERVGILAVNGVDFVASFFGAVLAGKPAVALNYLLSPEEIGALVRHSGMKTLVASRAFGELGKVLPVKVLEAEEVAKPGWGAKPAVKGSADSAAVLLYTSGTTSRPKGVLLSHRNLLTDSLAAAEWFGVVEEDRFLCALPLFHSFGLNCVMMVPLFSGAGVVYHKRFSAVSALRDIEKERLTVTIAVSSMCRALVGSEMSERADVSSMKTYVVGGERLPNELALEMAKVMGIEPFQGYGLTEASPVVSGNNRTYSKLGTVGKPIPGVSVGITADDGKHVPAGREGEVMVKGENVMMGYLDMPEETKAALTKGGWLRTGDLGFVDEEGFLTITGRKKELIICGGINISPYRVEEVVGSHPAAKEVVVVGEADAMRGEVPVAYVVMRDGMEADEGELKRFCRKSLGGYEVPRRFYFLAEIPRSKTGKVLRRELKPPATGR